MSTLDAVTFGGDGSEDHPFPPPVIAKWLQRGAVSCDALVQELAYWANHMAGGTVVGPFTRVESKDGQMSPRLRKALGDWNRNHGR